MSISSGGEVGAALAEPRRDPRTSLLLEAPIVRTLLRMAAPNVLVMVAQASTGLVETYFVGKLGTDALAGVALVFPGVMLMQMMSAGAMGGGISSAIARALGGGRRNDADALVSHALVISTVLGALFTIGVSTGGPTLYRALGGYGASLDAALAYSNIVFGGAVLIWVFNTLASVLRGTGNMIVPAVVTCAGAVLLIPLSPCLIFGWGPFPRLGVAGGGTAMVLYYVLGTCVLAAYLWSGRSVVRPKLRGVRLRWPLFRDILRIGAVAALVTVQNNLTVLGTTGLIGNFGRGDRRLRRRDPARISARPARLRARRPVGGARRHQHRRRPQRPRFARRVDRRGDRLRHQRGNWGFGGAVPRQLAVSVRRRSGHDCRRIGLSPGRRAILRLLRSGARTLFQLAGRRPTAMATMRRDLAAPDRHNRGLANAALDWGFGPYVHCPRSRPGCIRFGQRRCGQGRRVVHWAEADTAQRCDIRALVAGKVIECGASRAATARILLSSPVTTTRRPSFRAR